MTEGKELECGADVKTEKDKKHTVVLETPKYSCNAFCTKAGDNKYIEAIASGNDPTKIIYKCGLGDEYCAIAHLASQHNFER